MVGVIDFVVSTLRMQMSIMVALNPNVFEQYKKQCVAYEKILTGNGYMYFEDDKFISEVQRKLQSIDVVQRTYIRNIGN